MRLMERQCLGTYTHQEDLELALRTYGRPQTARIKYGSSPYLPARLLARPRSAAETTRSPFATHAKKARKEDETGKSARRSLNGRSGNLGLGRDGLFVGESYGFEDRNRAQNTL